MAVTPMYDLPFSYRGFAVSDVQTRDRLEEVPELEYDAAGAPVLDADGEPKVVRYRMKRRVYLYVDARARSAEAVTHCGGAVKEGAYLSVAPEIYENGALMDLGIEGVRAAVQRRIDEVWALTPEQAQARYAIDEIEDC